MEAKLTLTVFIYHYNRAFKKKICFTSAENISNLCEGKFWIKKEGYFEQLLHRQMKLWYEELFSAGVTWYNLYYSAILSMWDHVQRKHTFYSSFVGLVLILFTAHLASQIWAPPLASEHVQTSYWHKTEIWISMFISVSALSCNYASVKDHIVLCILLLKSTRTEELPFHTIFFQHTLWRATHTSHSFQKSWNSFHAEVKIKSVPEKPAQTTED